MSFFNRKEEVIDLKLTPHGRYLLSVGKLNPTYYAFYDDDVLYDSDYTRILGRVDKDEVQNNIEERIEDRTPRVHTQHSFKERTPNLFQYDTYEGMTYLQNTHEREHGLVSPLGNNDVHTDFAPAWDIKVHKGALSSSFDNYTGSGPTYSIPQLNFENIEYELLLGNNAPNVSGPDPLFPNDERDMVNFADSSYLEIRKDFLLVEINEANTPYEKENFEIEFFEVIEETDRAGNIRETLNPLNFGLLEKQVEVDEVSYYINGAVDSEIELARLCRYRGSDNTDNTFLPPIFICPGVTATTEVVDPYETLVSESDIGDACIEDC